MHHCITTKQREQGFDSTELQLEFMHRSNFFSRNLSLLTSYRVAAVLVLWTAAVPVYRIAVRPPYEDLCSRTDAVVTYFEAGLAVALIALAYKIRSTTTDVFGVKRELKYHGLLSILHVAFQIVIGIFGIDSRSALGHVETVLVLWLLFRVSLWGPIRKSYHRHGVILKTDPAHTTKMMLIPPQFATFAALTSTKPGKLSFQQHVSFARCCALWLTATVTGTGTDLVFEICCPINRSC